MSRVSPSGPWLLDNITIAAYFVDESIKAKWVMNVMKEKKLSN